MNQKNNGVSTIPSRACQSNSQLAAPQRKISQGPVGGQEQPAMHAPSTATLTPQAIHAVFDQPATAQGAGMRYTVDLAASDTEQVQAVAARCGLEVMAFLEQYLCRTLPGQPPPSQDARPLPLRPCDVAFACSDPALLARIERAAKFQGKSLEEYVAKAVASSVLTDEDDMILHPQTGELVGDALVLENMPGFHCPQVVAAPLGQPTAEWLEKYPGLNRVFAATDIKPTPAEEPGSFRGTFEVPAGPRDHGCRYEIVLNAESAEFVRQVAAEAGMELEAFVQAFLAKTLPNQERHRQKALPKGKLPRLDFVPTETLRRLQRIADFMDKTLEGLVLDDWSSTIEMFERDMIFHPRTGEIIGDASEGEFEGLRNPASQEVLTGHTGEEGGA